MNKHHNHPFQLLAITGAMALLVSACGGGGTPTAIVPTPATGTVTLSGSAATGLALGNATVAIKCATGSGTTTTSSAGAYSATLNNAALPCVLKVTSSDRTITYHSVAAGSGGGTAVANVTPLTELVVAQATGMSPAQFFSNFTSAQNQVVAASSLDAAVAEVATALNSAVSIGPLNPLTGALVPATLGNLDGGNAYDLLLDQLQISIENAGTTLDALTAVVSNPTGGTATLGSTLQSPLSAGIADGFFDVYHDGTSWTLNAHQATGPQVNGVYPMRGAAYKFLNGAWSTNYTDPNDSLFLGPNGWVSEPLVETATTTQTTTSTFSYANTIGMALDFNILTADVSSVNLADIDPNLSGVVGLPTGSKVFSFTSTYGADEYRLNGGTGFNSVASLDALRNNYASNGPSYLTWMGGSENGSSPSQLAWQFGPGSTSGTLFLFTGFEPFCTGVCTAPVSAPANGTWQLVTRNGVQLMELTMPSSAGPNGLFARQTYFYSMIPGGNAQEGIHSTAGASAGGFNQYNRTAVNAILTAIGGLPAAPN